MVPSIIGNFLTIFCSNYSWFCSQLLLGLVPICILPPLRILELVPRNQHCILPSVCVVLRTGLGGGGLLGALRTYGYVTLCISVVNVFSLFYSKMYFKS